MVSGAETMGVILVMSSGTRCWRVEVGSLGDRGIEGGPVILLSPPLPLWLFSGFSVCTSASNTLPLLFSSSGELSNSDPFKVSRGCPS